MKLYKQRPDVVEAVHWTGENVDEAREFIGLKPGDEFVWLGNPLGPGSPEPVTDVYLVRPRGGGVKTLSPGEFHATYEPLI